MLKTKSRNLTRTVETKDFVENGQLTFDLPLGYDLNSVIIRVSGTVTVGTAPTSYHEYGMPRLLDRIDIYSNGKNKFHEITGLMACLGNFEQQGANTLVDISSGTGAKTVDCYFRISNANEDGPRPKDSNLHTVKPFMSKLQIKLATGALLDMVHTAGSVAFSSFALTVEIMVEETIEFQDIAYFENRMVKTQSMIEETIDATKSSHRVKLPSGELMTRGVKIYALDENGALSNAVINSASMKSGVDVAYSKNGADIREANKVDYKLQLTQQPDGFYYLDMTPKGNLNQIWDTRGLAELDLVLDVTKPAGGDATLVIVPQQFYEQDSAELRAQVAGSNPA
jgi:hypothetical protein